jgi:hypothetical protein
MTPAAVLTTPAEAAVVNKLAQSGLVTVKDIQNLSEAEIGQKLKPEGQLTPEEAKAVKAIQIAVSKHIRVR